MMRFIGHAYATTRGHITALVLAAIAGGFSIIVLSALRGREAAMDEWDYLVAGLIGSCGAVLLTFLWNLVCAPYRLEREAHAGTRVELENVRREIGATSAILTERQRAIVAREALKIVDALPKVTVIPHIYSTNAASLASDIVSSLKRVAYRPRSTPEFFGITPITSVDLG